MNHNNKKFLHAIFKNEKYYSERNTVIKGNKTLINIESTFLSLNPSIILSRLTRQKIHQIIPYDDGIVVLIKKKFLVFTRKGKYIGEIAIERGSRPLKQGAVIIDNHLYFGDYWGNKNRLPVNLYKVNLSNLAKSILYDFKHVRHIHSVQEDSKFENKLLVCTGDSDSESGIYQISISSGSIEVLCEGSQECRAVSILQNGDEIFWGSDSPNNINSIYKLNRLASAKIDKICEIEGPAYYSAKLLSGEMFISTAVEDRSKHKSIIYKSSDDGVTWDKYKTFQKDMWPNKLFGYGLVEFPLGIENIDELVYTKVGLY